MKDFPENATEWIASCGKRCTDVVSWGFSQFQPLLRTARIISRHKKHIFAERVFYVEYNKIIKIFRKTLATTPKTIVWRRLSRGEVSMQQNWWSEVPNSVRCWALQLFVCLCRP